MVINVHLLNICSIVMFCNVFHLVNKINFTVLHTFFYHTRLLRSVSCTVTLVFHALRLLRDLDQLQSHTDNYQTQAYYTFHTDYKRSYHCKEYHVLNIKRISYGKLNGSTFARCNQLFSLITAVTQWVRRAAKLWSWWGGGGDRARSSSPSPSPTTHTLSLFLSVSLTFSCTIYFPASS